MTRFKYWVISFFFGGMINFIDEVCRVCGLPTYLSVDRCPYCGEKYGNRREIIDCNLINLCTVNELRKLCGLKDI